jgi:hypothetical protein
MASTEFLDGFFAWARKTALSIQSERITAVVEVCPPTSNPAANLHFDSDELLARITCWSDGSYCAEALDVATGDAAFSRHGQLAEATASRLNSKIFSN